MAAEPETTVCDDLLLPLEIWRKILSRLPAKSILRCRSVCKSWYSLVSCPSFISYYYSTRNLKRNSNRLLVQLYDVRAHVYSFSSHDPFRGREHSDVPEAFLDSNLKIVGSCNGLICLSRYYWTRNDAKSISFTFLIWNPTISKVVELPSRTFSSSRAGWKLEYSYGSTGNLVDVPDLNFSYFGFGFDSMTSDYKVMCMCTNSDDDFSDVGANVCDIYDLSKGAWRGVTPLMHPWKVGHPTSDCYLDGAVHWTGYRHGKMSHRILLSFNMSDEVFRETRMPGCAEFTGDVDVDDRSIRTRSLAFEGLIHVIVWDIQRFLCMSQDCSVWAMKEYGVAESWTKLFSLNLLGALVSPVSDPDSFLLWKNDEVLMVHDYDDVIDDYEEFGSNDELVLYNTGSKTCKCLFSFDKHISNVCLYEESLFLM